MNSPARLIARNRTPARPRAGRTDDRRQPPGADGSRQQLHLSPLPTELIAAPPRLPAGLRSHGALLALRWRFSLPARRLRPPVVRRQLDAAAIQGAVDRSARPRHAQPGLRNLAGHRRAGDQLGRRAGHVRVAGGPPANFFNATSPRGVVFSTPGTGFLVSRKAAQTSPEFADIDPTYPSPSASSARAALPPSGSTVTDVNFSSRRRAPRRPR